MLIETGAVQKLPAGRYIPTDRYVSLRTHDSSVQVHGLTPVVAMLTAVSHNIATDDEVNRFAELAASNAHIPIRALPIIHRRIKRLLTRVYWKVDEYLRGWEVRPGSEPTTRLRVGGYASEDPIVTGQRKLSRAPK